MLPISVCIPVLNEQKNLPGCLESLKGKFSDVVIVDSGSSDATLSIAEKANLTVLNFKWNGAFPKKRNWALQNHSFKHEWVLFLDADERITPAFLDEVKSKLDSKMVGFWLRYDNWFMDRQLHHGDVMRKLALFKPEAGGYERFPEDFWSHLDMEVHEHPVLDGPTEEIFSPLEHHDFRGLESYIAKHKEYAAWEAKRYQWLQSDPEAWTSLNKRQQFKYRHLSKWWLGSFYFLISYFLKKGFLDGRVGFRFSWIKKGYFEDIRRRILTSKTS